MRLRAVIVGTSLALAIALPTTASESPRTAKAALIEEYMQVTQAERTMEEALRLAFDSSDDQIRESLGVTETELG
ncbi:MAG: hypothetical protein HYU52_15075, partial [Acidobacteria bacterium]|nr:hypothetical protein [Acidobacteriota bacterium]